MYKLFVLAFLMCNFFFFFSCSTEKYKHLVELKQTGDTCSFVIPDDVKCSSLFVQMFTENGKNYLVYKNEFEQEILFYELDSGKMIKRITFPREGKNSIVGGFLGFQVYDFNHIYIPSIYQNKIYLSDSTGNINRIIDFERTVSGQELIPFIPCMYGEIVFMDNKLYIPQTINPKLGEGIIENSPICAVIDTLSGNNHVLPMKFPRLITKRDIGTSAGVGLNYFRCFDGKRFIYSFYYSDNLYAADINHSNVTKYTVKSIYANAVEVPNGQLTERNEMLKYNLEHSRYGRIYYDSYREVFYRIVYHEGIYNKDEKKSNVASSSRRKFSIMILDKDLNIIGETLFPGHFFEPNLLFITEKGLYISTNAEGNPNFNEDFLKFERVELCEL
jgi:hypothetical protein